MHGTPRLRAQAFFSLLDGPFGPNLGCCVWLDVPGLRASRRHRIITDTFIAASPAVGLRPVQVVASGVKSPVDEYRHNGARGLAEHERPPAPTSLLPRPRHSPQHQDVNFMLVRGLQLAASRWLHVATDFSDDVRSHVDPAARSLLQVRYPNSSHTC